MEILLYSDINIKRDLPKQAEAKRDGVINPQNYNFNQNFNLNCLHITFKGFSSGKIMLLDRENSIPV